MARKSFVITVAILFLPLMLIYFVTVVFLEQIHQSSGESTKSLGGTYRNSNDDIFRVTLNEGDDDGESDSKDAVIDCSEQLLYGAFNGITLNDLNKEEIEFSIQQYCLNGEERCQTPTLLGPLKVKIASRIESYNSRLNFVEFGGWWSPSYCIRQKKKVAIVIPYRDDVKEHLAILLNHLHPILKRQQLHYRIFVVQPKDESKFCKGSLMNAGFLEIEKLFPYNCFVLHDVDMLPLDDRIDYSCASSPMQLSVLTEESDNNIKTKNLLGRVVSFSPSDFKIVNGLSNSFCTGNEADKLYKRISAKGLKPVRESFERGRYTTLKHKTNNLTHIHKHTEKSYISRRKVSTRAATVDGLKSIKYNIVGIEKRHYYTLIKIDELGYIEENDNL